MNKLFLITLLVFISGNSYSQSEEELLGEESVNFFKEKSRGWFWYQDPPTPAKSIVKPLPAQKKPLNDAEAALYEFKEMQRNLEDLKKIAIMRPTEQNIKAYMYFQQLALERSSTFADQAQRIAWTTPQLDASINARPTNNIATQVYDELQKQQQRQSLSNLANSHGLFFVFRSDCPYCHRFAPTLKRFEQMYGIKVFPISLDGKGLPEYPRPAADNGFSARLNTDVVPALYLATPSKKEIQPIGYGLLAETEIIERIYTLTSVPVGGRGKEVSPVTLSAAK